MTDIPDRQERERSERNSNLRYVSLAGSKSRKWLLPKILNHTREEKSGQTFLSVPNILKRGRGY